MTEKPCETAAAQHVLAEIAAACERSGRNPESVTLMAVTKTVAPERVNRLLDMGVTLIGENRVQEYLSKREAYHRPYTMHIIGHLQTNKVRDIIQDAACIESVDSLHLLEKISAEAVRCGRVMPCLLEWNVGGEASKTGASEEEIRAMLKVSAGLEGVRIDGLMCVPPVCTPEESRAYFAETADLFRALQKTPEGRQMQTLSMGMSHDYTVAVEEGATIVRVGSALFGARQN